MLMPEDMTREEAAALAEIERIEAEFPGPYALAVGDETAFMDRETRAKLAEIREDVRVLIPSPPDGYRVRVASYNLLLSGREYVREIPLALLNPAWEAFRKMSEAVWRAIDEEERELLADEVDWGGDVVIDDWDMEPHEDCPRPCIICGNTAYRGVCSYKWCGWNDHGPSPNFPQVQWDNE